MPLRVASRSAPEAETFNEHQMLAVIERIADHGGRQRRWVTASRAANQLLTGQVPLLPDGLAAAQRTDGHRQAALRLQRAAQRRG
jgi:hypothetical protein